MFSRRRSGIALEIDVFDDPSVGRDERDARHQGSCCWNDLVSLHRGFDGLPDQLSWLLSSRYRWVRIPFGRTALGGNWTMERMAERSVLRPFRPVPANVAFLDSGRLDPPLRDRSSSYQV